MMSNSMEEISSVIDYNGDNLIKIRPFERIPEFLGPTIALCSLNLAVEILKSKNYPGVYCNLDNFKCTKYYPYYHKYLLNNPYVMLPYGSLIDLQYNLFNWLGNNDSLFIRPNSGFKEFTGQIVTKENFDKEISQLECVEPNSDLLCLIAEPRNIKTEWRLAITNKKVVGCSTYRVNGEHEEIEGFSVDVCNFAQKVITDVAWEPDFCYTMDVCQLSDGEFKLVELNSFSCSGLYACDLTHIINEVRKVICKDWQDVYC